MLKNELVSIVVPIYNVEQYLCRCIDSILKQSYKKLEIILVDDGSTDNSPQICEDYKSKDERIIVIHKNNHGIAAARNTGAAAARGKWICFVDSDDYVSYDYIEYLLNLCYENDAEISCCMYDLVFPENTMCQKHYVKRESYNKTEIYTAEEFTYLLLCDKVASYAWNKLFLATFWKEIHFNEEMVIYEDSTTIYRVSAKCNRIVYGSESKYYYVQRDNSLLHTDKNKRFIYLYFDVIEQQENSVRQLSIKTKRKVPFDLIRLENSRRYVNYCIENNITIDVIDGKIWESTRNKLQIVKLFFYHDIFDIKSILSNIIFLISKKTYYIIREVRL